MVLSTSNTSNAHEFVIDDVISKARCDLVYSGELDESVLSQIQSWKTKMIQAGVISGTIETCSASFNPSPTHTPLQTREPNPAQFLKSDPPMGLMMATKTECDEFYIPQQDGARDLVTQPNSCDFNDVDENEELLNEDDDDEEDAIDDDDSNIPHMVLCQFDKVKRCKSKWECKFNAGIMQINGKNVLFSEATGDFNF
ncbi:transcription initiation factor IIA subunit 1 isoform X2 [Capsella rubella]|uniref:transcription initiation factor IIA subunit 1 isoform X2 n=1 Tax=Capsella rubella TaxID=81985 RepID=UPI000CD59A3B|nr:transcription initiation factor IIA subunit 1 isoform X2 [Capsella rubella]